MVVNGRNVRRMTFSKKETFELVDRLAEIKRRRNKLSGSGFRDEVIRLIRKNLNKEVEKIEKRLEDRGVVIKGDEVWLKSPTDPTAYLIGYVISKKDRR